MTEWPEELPGIALVGIAGRFPAADGAAALWRLIAASGHSMQSIDPAALAQTPHAGRETEPGYVAMKSALRDYQCFDAGFFGFSAREASFMDPQHRLLLECAWHAFEDAGIRPGDDDQQRTGVFASVNLSTYLLGHVLPHLYSGALDPVDIVIANDKDYVATRLAHKLNLHGPAMGIQTACSSSLVAIHQACQALLAQECDRALVAASSIMLPTDIGYAYTEGGIRSSDGYCRPFDARGNGTLFASSAVAVLLRRVEDACRDGDPIYAVLRGSAVNNDGARRVGFTAPSVEGQAHVISEAIAMAGVDAADIELVEAHGTATPLGDPIEVAALSQAFAAASAKPRQHPCVLSSVKANLGHLDTAAGVTGLIKAALCLQHQVLPETLHFETPNPRLALEQTPFRILRRHQSWPAPPAGPRLAGVSAFGVGGSNAHVVLQEAPAAAAPTPERRYELLSVSARSAAALQANALALADALEAAPASLSLADIAWTLCDGRTAMPHRRTLVARGRQEAIALLRQPAAPVPATGAAVWLFSGQGAQHPGMYRGLAARLPGFAKHLAAIRQVFLDGQGPDLQQLLDLLAQGRQLQDTAEVQPLIFGTQWALGQSLLDLGLTPAALLGHSVGELAAACLAGVMSMEAGARLVAVRGRLMAASAAGGMLSCVGPASRVLSLLADPAHAELDLAAHNGPEATTLAGPVAALEHFAEAAAAAGLQCQRLSVARAFHSRSLDQAATALNQQAARFSWQEPRWPVISNVTGQVATASTFAAADYWGRQMRSTVQFETGLNTLLQQGRTVLMAGPGTPFAGLARAAGASNLLSLDLRAGDQQGDAGLVTLQSLGHLWSQGAPVRLQGLFHDCSPRRVRLPGYAFQRQKYWIAPSYERFAPGDATPDTDTGDTPAVAQPPALARLPRPALAMPYRAPRNALERQLAELWQALLLVEPIGIDDTFVALGGDSIQALQLARMAALAGLALAPRQVLEAGTIAALSEQVSPLDPVQQGAPDELPDLPVFKSAGRHWRRLDHPWQSRQLPDLARNLVTAFDALRLQPGAEGGWRVAAPADALFYIQPCAPGTLDQALAAQPDNDTNLILLHDADNLWLTVSARFCDATSASLLADSAIRWLRNPSQPLPEAPRLSRLLHQLYQRWPTPAAPVADPVPQDFITGPVQQQWRLPGLRAGLQQCEQQLGATPEETLLALLFHALRQLPGQVADGPVGLPHDDRRTAGLDAAALATLGPLTGRHAVFLAGTADSGLEELILQVKETLRAQVASAPGTRWHTAQPVSRRWDFNWLGHAGEASGGGMRLNMEGGPAPMAVNAGLDAEGALRITVEQAPDGFPQAVDQALEALQSSLANPAGARYTPTDFAEVDLNQSDLDALLGQL